MYISKFRIRNYKSYLDSNEVSLERGINIITGQNNVGKTAMLESLSLNFHNQQHKSTKTKSTSISPLNDPSIIEIELYFTKQELISFVFEFLPEIRLQYPRDNNIRLYEGSYFFNQLLEENNVIYFVINGAGAITSAYLKKLGYNAINQVGVFQINKDNYTLKLTSQSSANSSFFEIANHFKSRVYYFHAQRFNISHHSFGRNTHLKPDASNLPEVLGILQSEKKRFTKYLQYVKNIFPNIIDISIRPHQSHTGYLEILIQNEELNIERPDLLVPLSESGTGIGQVLAILYVVLTSDVPKTIIIDEPNSFLHPGAARKLIELLKEHPQHQFIISTHSPSTIAAANPKTINIVRTEKAESFIEAIDVNETNKQQLYLAEIGAKLSDVFGADNILWVEGKTEEICFPKIIEATKDLSLMGTSVVGVKNTGDFQKNNSDLIFDIYRKLSNGKGLMPPAVGFIFDREKLTDKAIEDLKRKSENLVNFTNRRMYESYLINPKAIFNILKNIESIADLNLTVDSVTEWLNNNKWLRKYSSVKIEREKNEEEWITNFDAAKLLEDSFSGLTNRRVSFDKITHSVALTEWIIENSIEDLKEIQELLRQFLTKS